MGVDIKHMEEKDEAIRDAILDFILTEDETFTEMAVGYARDNADLIPDLSFFDYAVNRYIRQTTPEHKNAWRDENEVLREV